MKKKELLTEVISSLLIVLVIGLVFTNSGFINKYNTSNKYFNLLDINMNEVIGAIDELSSSNENLVKQVEQLTAEVNVLKSNSLGSNSALNKVYPIGSIYISTELSSPTQVHNAIGGTWEVYGNGRVLKSSTGASGQTGGSDTVTLTANNLPSHSHTMAHTHNYTPAGTNTIGGTANLTTGNQSANHTHRLPASGNFTGSTNSTGNHRHDTTTIMRHTTDSPDYSPGGLQEGGSFVQYKWKLRGDMYTTANGAHSHTFSLAATNTGNNTSSGNYNANHTHTISAANLKTAIGTITFTGTAGTTSTNNGNTGSAGSGTAFSVLDPYITVYMYKRTA